MKKLILKKKPKPKLILTLKKRPVLILKKKPPQKRVNFRRVA